MSKLKTVVAVVGGIIAIGALVKHMVRKDDELKEERDIFNEEFVNESKELQERRTEEEEAITAGEVDYNEAREIKHERVKKEVNFLGRLAKHTIVTGAKKVLNVVVHVGACIGIVVLAAALADKELYFGVGPKHMTNKDRNCFEDYVKPNMSQAEKDVIFANGILENDPMVSEMSRRSKVPEWLVDKVYAAEGAVMYDVGLMS